MESISLESPEGHFGYRRGRVEVRRPGTLTLSALQGVVQGAELLGVPPLADVVGMSVRSHSDRGTVVALDWVL